VLTPTSRNQIFDEGHIGKSKGTTHQKHSCKEIASLFEILETMERLPNGAGRSWAVRREEQILALLEEIDGRESGYCIVGKI
jgi:hypothetical protein